MTSRIAPVGNDYYALNRERLDEIRKILMYPYFDFDIHGNDGDLEVNINTQNTQLNKQLSFLLPFFGFGLNYTWVSLFGAFERKSPQDFSNYYSVFLYYI